MGWAQKESCIVRMQWDFWTSQSYFLVLISYQSFSFSIEQVSFNVWQKTSGSRTRGEDYICCWRGQVVIMTQPDNDRYFLESCQNTPTMRLFFIDAEQKPSVSLTSVTHKQWKQLNLSWNQVLQQRLNSRPCPEVWCLPDRQHRRRRHGVPVDRLLTCAHRISLKCQTIIREFYLFTGRQTVNLSTGSTSSLASTWTN